MKHTPNTNALRTFAQAIGEARRNAGIKQDAAAKLLRLSRTTLSGYENGNLEGFSIVTLFNMSRVYNCPLPFFFQPPAPEAAENASPPRFIE